MSLSGVFQVGYVTHDIERAIRHGGAVFGVQDFTTMEITLPLQTPAGERQMSLRVATAWAGALQFELIQPVSGYVEAYRQELPDDPEDFVPRFHHLAVRRDDPDALAREIADLALPVVFRTGGNGIASAFLDGRSRVGHHIEFVCADPSGWAMLGWPEAS